MTYHIDKKYCQVIVRHANEQSLGACKKSLKACGFADDAIHFSTADSFKENLLKSVKIGKELITEWVFMIDGDVILEPNSFNNCFKALSEFDGYHEVQFLIFDKLFREYRPAGNHFYKTKFLNLFSKYVLENDELDRPETRALKLAEKDGYKWKTIPMFIGFHDFKQSNRDIFEKAFVHGKKHKKNLGQLLVVAQKNEYDLQYQFAKNGYILGALSDSEISLARGNKEVSALYENLEINRDSSFHEELRGIVLETPLEDTILINDKIVSRHKLEFPKRLWYSTYCFILNGSVRILDILIRKINKELRVKIGKNN